MSSERPPSEVIPAPEVPKDAPISYEDYVDYLCDFQKYHGVIALDEVHGHFAWLQYKYPELKDIDGATIADIYEANVHTHEMSQKHFLGVYIPTLLEDFPALLSLYDEAASQEAADDLQAHVELAQERYEVMADHFGIDISEGMVLRFYDKEGEAYDLFTDADARGTRYDQSAPE